MMASNKASRRTYQEYHNCLGAERKERKKERRQKLSPITYWKFAWTWPSGASKFQY
jgi:hypothetical protein